MCLPPRPGRAGGLRGASLVPCPPRARPRGTVRRGVLSGVGGVILIGRYTDDRGHGIPPRKVGERLFVYAGLRTRRARKLGEGVRTSLERIEISASGASTQVDDRTLSAGGEIRLAIDDGFLSPRQPIAWIAKTHLCLSRAGSSNDGVPAMREAVLLIASRTCPRAPVLHHPLYRRG